MNYQRQFMPISIKNLPINDENNFLTTLQSLQLTTPRAVDKKEEIRCESQYLKALQKLQTNSFVDEKASEKRKENTISIGMKIISPILKLFSKPPKD